MNGHQNFMKSIWKMQRTNFKEVEKELYKNWFFKGIDSLKVNPKLSDIELEMIFDDEFENYYDGKR